MRVFVTGGAGFIGSAVCRHFVQDLGFSVVNFDKLTYAANLSSLREIQDRPEYHFIEGDICQGEQVLAALREHRIDALIHLAAESHVDRSIDGPADCITTNIVGTYALLQAARTYWETDLNKDPKFRFHHVSTDEVYGDLPFNETKFTEQTAYAPSSPYSASKAASDHLVQAWHSTYGLPILMSNCSNNYGPYHFPEKLIPLMILNGLAGEPLPIYGTGQNVRDWLHVEDHARALALILQQGQVGETYNIGADQEFTNIAVVERICDCLDAQRPLPTSHRELIEFVADRPGHDRRYAIDATKLRTELDWKPHYTFEQGLDETVEWYLNNEWWWRPIREERYAGQRLGKLSQAAKV